MEEGSQCGQDNNCATMDVLKSPVALGRIVESWGFAPTD